MAYLLTTCAMQINATITKTALELDTGAMIQVDYNLILYAYQMEPIELIVHRQLNR